VGKKEEEKNVKEGRKPRESRHYVVEKHRTEEGEAIRIHGAQEALHKCKTSQ
jgi:hypothetical protein